MKPSRNMRVSVPVLLRGFAVFLLIPIATGCTLQSRPDVAAEATGSVCGNAWMATQGHLVRDLTAAYGVRRYVREDGSLCRPVSEETVATGTVPAAPAPVPVVMSPAEPVAEPVAPLQAGVGDGDATDDWFAVFRAPPTAAVPSVWNAAVLDL